MTFNPFESVENHHSREKIELNLDQKIVATKSIDKIIDGLLYLREKIQKDTVDVCTRYNIIGISKYEIQDLQECLGGKDDIKQDKEHNEKSLRHANIENARLKDELGKSISVQAIASKLNLLKQEVYDFWKDLGFLHSDIKFSAGFNDAYVTGEFSCYISDHISTFSKNPVTEKQKVEEKIEKLKAKVEVAKISTGLVLVDSEHNRKFLIDVFKERFPSSRIQKIKCHVNDDLYYIREINVFMSILDIGDNHKEFKW